MDERRVAPPTAAPSYPAVPVAGPHEAGLPLADAPVTSEAPPPLPAPESRNDDAAPARASAHAVATASAQGVPAPPDARIDAVDDPGPLGAAERRAVTGLTPRVVALAGLAEKVDGEMRRYVKACRRERLTVLPVAASARRDWPVPLLLDPAIAPSRDERSNVDSTGCLALWDEVRAEADRLASALDDMRDFARSQGLLPGHVRDALAEYRLDGWERYPGR